jgi:hypothetical protein
MRRYDKYRLTYFKALLDQHFSFWRLTLTRIDPGCADFFDPPKRPRSGDLATGWGGGDIDEQGPVTQPLITSNRSKA